MYVRDLIRSGNSLIEKGLTKFCHVKSCRLLKKEVWQLFKQAYGKRQQTGKRQQMESAVFHCFSWCQSFKIAQESFYGTVNDRVADKVFNH